MRSGELPVLTKLSELVELVEREPHLYVRWSTGPDDDLTGMASVDQLTGVPLPGLSASPLDAERWWGDHPLRLWVARRLYDYAHLRFDKGPGVRPWVLHGEETARGPDNEPLVRYASPVAWIDQSVIDEATAEVTRAHSEWGSLRRAPGSGACASDASDDESGTSDGSGACDDESGS